MEKSLLFELISDLLPSERNEAKRWLASEVHNQRTDSRQLFAILCEYIDLSVKPERASIWQKLSPGTPFDDQQLRLVSSYLLTRLEEWLAWRHWLNHPTDQALHLIKAYRSRGLDRHFSRRTKALDKRLVITPLRDSQHYRYRYDLQLELFRKEAEGERTRHFNLQDQEDNLLCALLGERLRQACLSNAHRSVYDTEYRDDLLAESLQLAEREPYRDAPVVAVYRAVYLAQASPDDTQPFQSLRELIFAHLSCFSMSEMRNILLLAINVGIRKINQGEKSYLSEVWQLYRQALEADLLTVHGHLTPFTFNNISVIGIHIGELNWVANFLHVHNQRLEPPHRLALLALNSARLAYARNDYATALLHLQDADYRDFIHGMSARILQIKLYYALREGEALAAHLKNTRAYLNRRKHLGYHERNYKNILHLTEQLLKANPHDKAVRTKLRVAIEESHPLTERSWLLEQWERMGDTR